MIPKISKMISSNMVQERANVTENRTCTNIFLTYHPSSQINNLYINQYKIV